MSTVDARAVLRVINSMGYKNVSTDELKEFTKGKYVIHFDREQYPNKSNTFSISFRSQKVDEI